MDEDHKQCRGPCKRVLPATSFASRRGDCRECRRSQDLLRRYGVTLQEFNTLFDYQRGECAVCHRHPAKQRFAVDHDHTTGAVRGLLCRRCNLALGLFNDSTDLLWKSIIYLRHHTHHNDSTTD